MDESPNNGKNKRINFNNLLVIVRNYLLYSVCRFTQFILQ